MERVVRHVRQGGYVLLEITVAMLIASLLAVWGAQVLVNRYADAQAQSAAVWMDTVRQAVDAYIRHHGADIQAAAGSDALSALGFADWRAPTLSELIQAGLMSPGVPISNRLTGAARVSVWHRGDCPGASCTIEALVHGERPLIDDKSGQPDEAMIAQWLLASAGRGVAVHVRDPGRIQGTAFAFGTTLPDGTVLAVGTVGMAVTAGDSGEADYLRVRDARDPDFQGTLSVAGDVSTEGSATVSDVLVIGAQHRDGESCETEGAVSNEMAGGLLVCRNGLWRSSSRMGGGYSYNTIHGCAFPDGRPTANPLTGECECPGYTVAIPIFDTGARPYPEGRQVAYLCVG